MRKPVWIREDVTIAIHERALADHGGESGVRDRGLLESALARPQQIHAYDDPDLAALAAAYATGIIRNHPFIDGNKRVGFMVAYVFLSRNGVNLTARIWGRALHYGIFAGRLPSHVVPSAGEPGRIGGYGWT